MEQLADVATMLPESQMVDQLVAVVKLVDSAVPEQVVEVPKISCPSRPLRAALLVEVPTDVLVVLVEQIIGIPVLLANKQQTKNKKQKNNKQQTTTTKSALFCVTIREWTLPSSPFLELHSDEGSDGSAHGCDMSG